MKGARTDPLANTRSVPMSSMSRIRGKSHHFLRTFMKAQSSPIRLDFATATSVSELPSERSGRIFRPVVRHPEASLPFLGAKRVLAEQAHEEPGRGEDDEVHERHEDRRGDLGEEE